MGDEEEVKGLLKPITFLFGIAAIALSSPLFLSGLRAWLGAALPCTNIIQVVTPACRGFPIIWLMVLVSGIGLVIASFMLRH